MEYQVGQQVRIRPDLSADMDNVNGLMVALAGETATIERVHNTGRGLYYTLDLPGSQWAWSAHMLVAEKQKPEKPLRHKLLTPAKWTPKTQEQSLLDAIESIKNSYYGGTFIKGELEGELGRERDGECDECEGAGYWDCEYDHAEIMDEDGEGTDEYEDSCDHCEEGREICGGCDGNGSFGEAWGNQACREFMLEHVSQACREATVYSGFVVDGSVDSEFNFTIPIDHPEYFVEYIKAFKLLSEEIGNGLDVRGAGMHITILRSPTGSYPSNNKTIESVPFANFTKNLTKLMPALLLLASPDYKSRSISTYRRPGVGHGSHGHAIDIAEHGNSGVLEWRVFETCYNRPEMVYDYLCTIAKGLAYYHPNVKPVAFKSKIGKLEFQDDHAKYGVHKYYHTEKHLKALDEGLAYLVPDHRTIESAKRIRNFTLTPEKLRLKAQRVSWRVEDEYPQYAKTRKEKEEVYVQRHLHTTSEEIGYGMKATMTKARWLEYEKNLRAEFRKSNPVTRRAYINKKVKEVLEGNCSKHTITI